jgi:hypothetical protein
VNASCSALRFRTTRPFLVFVCEPPNGVIARNERLQPAAHVRTERHSNRIFNDPVGQRNKPICTDMNVSYSARHRAHVTIEATGTTLPQDKSITQQAHTRARTRAAIPIFGHNTTRTSGFLHQGPLSPIQQLVTSLSTYTDRPRHARCTLIRVKQRGCASGQQAYIGRLLHRLVLSTRPHW